MRNWSKNILAPTLLVAMIGALLVSTSLMAYERNDTYEWFEAIQDVRRMIRDFYVEDVDADQMEQLQLGAINGMIETLNDPYTEFIPAERLRDFDKATGGVYVGIGAEVNMNNGWFTIITPMPGSPALEAGLQAGDQIREIDGESTEGEPINDTIDRLMGEPGTPVAVKVFRDGINEDELLEFRIIRRQIEVETVEGLRRVGDHWDYFLDPQEKIAYLRLTQFTGNTYQMLAETLSGLIDDGLKGLVLDLRFNPGGRLDAAIGISDLFLEEGDIVSIKGRATPEQTWSAQRRGTLPDFPMVVLVNGQSASASEIVSGSLKDNDRAIVIGTRTFGKGKVQDVNRDLPSGAGILKITTAYYYLPSGRNIQRVDDSDIWGVDPSPGFWSPMTTAQYNQMLRIQRELDVIRNGEDGEGRWGDPDWIEDRLKDPQLSAAVEAIRLRLTDGEWVATGQEMPEHAEVLAELRRAERRQELLQEELDRTNDEIQQLMAFVPEDEADEADVDLIPGNPVLVGGVLEIRDPEGKIIAELRITDETDLELALLKAGVTPIDAETETETETDDDSN
ncbi:MAG: S41 family peptidase [Phycisphaerales bacterium]